MFFSVDVMLHFVSFNALPYSLGRKCVAQQAVCLYFTGCETPFTCNCVPDQMFPLHQSYGSPNELGRTF